MNKIDRLLSLTVVVLFATLLLAVAAKEYCGWRSITRLTAGCEYELRGRSIDVVFERTAILPDRIRIDSSRPEALVLEYDDGRWGLTKYRGVCITAEKGVIADVRNY